MLERCRRDSFQGTSFFASLQNIHRALLDFLLQRLRSSCILCFSFELLSVSVLVFSYGSQIQGWRRGCLCKSSQLLMSHLTISSSMHNGFPGCTPQQHTQPFSVRSLWAAGFTTQRLYKTSIMDIPMNGSLLYLPRLATGIPNDPFSWYSSLLPPVQDLFWSGCGTS
jgi:hypothetical protein